MKKAKEFDNWQGYTIESPIKECHTLKLNIFNPEEELKLRQVIKKATTHQAKGCTLLIEISNKVTINHFS